MKNKIGDIVLIPFPFSDLSDSKVRPAVILQFDQNDIVVVFITSKDVENSLQIEPESTNGLQVKSFIRYSKIATIDKSLKVGTLGCLSSEDLKKLKKKISNFLGL